MARRREDQSELVVVKEPETEHLPAEQPKPARIPMSFDAWWLLAQHRHKLKPELKQAVKKHLEVKGFMCDENFNEGLADFGIKP